jgi:hypothetical protein
MPTIETTSAAQNTAKALAVSLAAVLVVLVFFAPRLWLMDEVRPGTFQWDRASTYIAQSEDPFRTDIEAAMRWRIAPPLLAHALGLQGQSSLIIPWVGVLALLGYVASYLYRNSVSWRFTFAGTLLIASTSAVLVPLHWFGINDAWVWLGLLIAAFSPNRSTIIAAILLTAWVDERFIIGLPLALLVRAIDTTWSDRSQYVWLLLALLPYATLRTILGGNPATDEIGQAFISSHLKWAMTWIGLAPLAWWMGLRLAWVPVGYVFVAASAKERLLLASVGVATALVTLALAADLSRSSAIILPLVVAGLTRIQRDHPEWVNRYCISAALIGLLLPMVHVVGRKIDPVENILIELARVYWN